MFTACCKYADCDAALSTVQGTTSTPDDLNISVSLLQTLLVSILSTIAPEVPDPAPDNVCPAFNPTIKKKDDVQQAAEPPKEQTLHDIDPEIPKPDPKNTEENVTESVINDSETNKNVVNLPENVSKPEESVSEQGENVPEEQIPGQDDIMNHPEYLPEKKTDKQIIEDAKRTVEAIRLTLNDWEYTIPQGMLAAILDRVEYLKDTLQELVKGDADEDDV